MNQSHSQTPQWQTQKRHTTIPQHTPVQQPRPPQNTSTQQKPQTLKTSGNPPVYFHNSLPPKITNSLDKPIAFDHSKHPEPLKKRDNSHLLEQAGSPIKKTKSAGPDDAPYLPNIPYAASDSNEDLFSSDSSPNYLSQEINEVFVKIASHLKEKPIKTVLLEKDLLSLGEMSKNIDLKNSHPLFFQKMATIYLALGKKNKAADYMAKAQRRIQQLYFETIEIDSEEERNFSRLKMEIDLDKQFPNIGKAVQKQNKQKKCKPSDTYNLDNSLNAFVLTSTHEHQFLNSSYPELKDLFSTIEKNKRKKQKHLTELDSFSTIPEEESNEWDDDENIQENKKLKKLLKISYRKVLKECDHQEKEHLEEYKNTVRDKLQEKEIKRQLAVENTFFDPRRTRNSKVKTFAENIIAARYSPNGNSLNGEIEFNMTGENARTLITAE